MSKNKDVVPATFFQTSIDHLGSFAKSSTSAYSLASLFAICAPFSFPSGRDQNRIRAPSPNSPIGKALGQQNIRSVAALRPSLPPFWQLAGFAAFFGAGGYMIDQGDTLNGSGTVTAWSLIYLFFHGINVVRRPSIPATTLSLSTLFIGVSIHGSHYFNQTSWKGAVPGLSGSSIENKRSTSSLIFLTALPASALFTKRKLTSRDTQQFKRFFSSSRPSMSVGFSSKAARFSKPIDPSNLPVGFKVAATYAGIKTAISPVATPPSPLSSKAKAKPDLALITADEPVAAAGTFTRNVFKAAPVILSSELLSQGSKNKSGSRAKSVLVNSGCANAVTGKGGYQDAQKCAQLISQLRPSKNQDDNKTLLLSTGVIGVPLPMNVIERALPNITNNHTLSNEEESWWQVARAFMTTDTFPKLRTRTFDLGGRKCGMVGIDKGAGMIHPSMAGPSTLSRQLHATLLGLICTDAPISPPALQEALEEAMSRSFNCISVDGDMSTNDTIIALASGLAPEIKVGSSKIELGEEISKISHPQEYSTFVQELTLFCTEMAHLIVRDGEGAEKFIEIQVKGAPSYSDAHTIASSISTSALVKCALHGSDANWGRILCAAGYTNLRSSSSLFKTSDWTIDPNTISVRFLKPSTANKDDVDIVDELIVLQDGTPVKVDEPVAKSLLDLEDIVIEIDLKGGTWGNRGDKEMCKYWTCDFSKEYISINGDYRS